MERVTDLGILTQPIKVRPRLSPRSASLNNGCYQGTTCPTDNMYKTTSSPYSLHNNSYHQLNPKEPLMVCPL